MAKYGAFKYGTDRFGSSAPTAPAVPTAPTGTAPGVPAAVAGSSGSDSTLSDIPSVAYALDVTIDPFTATIADYGLIRLAWSTPGPTITDLVLVRGTSGYPMDTTDGTVLFSGAAQEINQYEDRTVLPGREYYYTLLIRQTGASTLYPATTLAPSTTLYPVASGAYPQYFPAASVRGVSPALKGGGDLLLDYLPRIFTSRSQDATGAPDPDTQLASFMRIFGLEMDRMKTDINNLVPFTDALTIPGPAVPLLASLMGQPYEAGIGYRQTRILTRDASYIYSRKGSANGISTFVKALTGQAATVSPGVNLFPDTDDSSAETSVGRWSSLTNATLTRGLLSTTIQEPPAPTAPALALPGGFTPAEDGSFIVTSAASGVMRIRYAGTSGTNYGLLVTPAETYAVSAYVKTASSGRAVTFAIRWYDADGALLSTSTQGSGTTDTTSYQRISYSATAPTSAVFASPTLTWSTPSASSEIHYVDCLQFERLGVNVTNYGFENGTLDPWSLTNPPSAVVNQITNTGFETGTTDWSGVASGYTTSTLSQRVAPSFGAHAGTAVLEVDWPTAGPGASCVYYAASDLIIGHRYRFSVWAYVPTNSPRVRIGEIFNAGTNTVIETGDTGTTLNAWVQLSFTTIATNTSMSFGVISDQATIAPVTLVTAGVAGAAFGQAVPGEAMFAAGSGGSFAPVITGFEPICYLDDASLVNLNYSGANIVVLDPDIKRSGTASAKAVGFLSGQDAYLWQTVKVRPGTQYQVSAYVDCTSFAAGALGNRGLYVDDGTGNPQVATLTATTSGFTAKTVTYTPTSSWLQIRLYIPQGTVHWDDVTIARTSPDPYADARRADVFVFPTRINFVTNPSFETNATGWSVTTSALSGYSSSAAVARSTTHQTTGAASGRVTHPTTTKSGVTTVLTDLTPGAIYTVAAQLFVPAGSRPVSIEHDAQPFTNASTTATIASSSLANLAGGTDYSLTLTERSAITDAVFTAQADTWTRISTQFTATDHVHVIGFYSLNTTSGQTFYLDDVLVEAANVLAAYFDGDTGVDYVWEGTAQLSRSQFMANRYTKSQRLARRLPDVLPTGTPYAVRTAWPGA